MTSPVNRSILIACLITVVVSVTFAQVGQRRGRLDSKARKLQPILHKLIPLHHTMGPVRPGDWLESHQERGQTFTQYVAERPIKLTKNRRVLYVLPLGEFNDHQQKIVELSADFLGRYFACKVKIMDTLSLEDAKIPNTAKRVHPSWGVRQILSTHILNKILKPRLPKDAFALISFTSSDLYPAESWNFVFGQASLRDRVGVWSIFRNGDPETEFKTCLSRTLKTATHETGHMISIRHCTAYECNMCGSNNLDESDRRPNYLCPQCVAKVWYATNCDPVKRFESLKEFCDKHDFTAESVHYGKCIQTLNNP